jgi:serine/threonine protein kinase
VDNVDDERFAQSPSAACSTLIAGRYELGPVIGQGSMARVYKATDTRTGKVVA